MKKTILMALAIVAIFSMSGCKSQKTLTEATTVADEEVVDVEPIQQAAASTDPEPEYVPFTSNSPQVITERVERVVVVNQGESHMLKGFNVIVGSFGTKTKAENQKGLMISRGYKAFLVQNPDGMFRVVAASFDTREEATAVRDRIRTTYPTEKGTCAEAWLLVPEK